MPLMDQVRGAYTDTRVAGAVLSCAALLALVLSAMDSTVSCRMKWAGVQRKSAYAWRSELALAKWLNFLCVKDSA